MKPPRDHNPRIADLARYRRARQRARKTPPPGSERSSQPFLGSRPRAGLILVLAILVFVALWLAPSLL